MVELYNQFQKFSSYAGGCASPTKRCSRKLQALRTVSRRHIIASYQRGQGKTAQAAA